MLRDKRAYWRRAAALYALALLRFALLGFSYRPLLDDYIQYYNYANLMGSLPEVVRTLGLFAARPLAGLADIVVWSHFWPCLFVAVALLAALLTAAALLFERLFDRMVGIGPLFACFFCFCRSISRRPTGCRLRRALCPAWCWPPARG